MPKVIVFCDSDARSRENCGTGTSRSEVLHNTREGNGSRRIRCPQSCNGEILYAYNIEGRIASNTLPGLNVLVHRNTCWSANHR